MQIAIPCVVSLSWRLEDTEGLLIGERVEPTEFLVGGNDLLARVEDALVGQEAGYSATLHLEPVHAFGDYDARLVCVERRAVVGEGVEPGMQFEGLPPGACTPGMPQDRLYTVTEVYPEHVVLDGNPPLAGRALVLAVVVRGVREATEDELRRGSATDPEAGWILGTVDRAEPGEPLH